MIRKYFVVYNSAYNEKEIEDMVDVYNLQFHYSRETYYQPEEQELTYDTWINKDLNKIVHIIFVAFDEQGEGREVRNINEHLLITVPEGEFWDTQVANGGYSFFDHSALNDEFDSLEKANSAIQAWIEEVAEEKAWEYWENRV